MNLAQYGLPIAPNAPTKIHPPYWGMYKLFDIAGTYSFIVPPNVFQLYAFVIGGGGAGAVAAVDSATNPSARASGGGGGGFASGVIDVIPGQTISNIIVGAGGSSAASTTFPLSTFRIS